MSVYIPNPEELGRRRFPDNKSFRKTLITTSADVLQQMEGLFASNYPKNNSTNLNILNLVFAREVARLNISMQMIGQDMDYTQTRVQFLQQILGERLGLGFNIAPVGYNDESYRNYLQAIKSADLKGGRLEILEILASKFTGQLIKINELYQEARRINSAVGVSAANKMIVQVLIDILLPGQNLNNLKDNLDFFINLVKPAHTLYDTQFIWTETLNINKIYNILFGDIGGGCVPKYNYDQFTKPVYLARQVFVLNGPEGATGFIESIHHADWVFYLQNSYEIVVEPGLNGTMLYGSEGKQISFNDLEIGQYVKVISQVIPGNFQFWWYPAHLFTSPYSQFYKEVYQTPLFQETVKKQMDAQGRFPLQIKTTPTTICDRWVQDALQPLYEDLRGNCRSGRQYSTNYSEILRKRKGYPKFYWPFTEDTITDSAILGSDFVQYMEHYPLTDGSGHPASSSDISVFIDSTFLPDVITTVDASSGKIYLNNTACYWEPLIGRYPINGDELTFNYKYLSDMSNIMSTTQTVFGISYWQTPQIPIVKSGTFGSLADITDITVYVDGTLIPNSVIALDPLFGHITLSPYSSFWKTSPLGRLPVPEIIIDGTKYPGDVFKFNYNYGENYSYGMSFDEPSMVMDALKSSNFPYSMVFDEPYTGEAVLDEDPETIGYRFRMYQLHHSSVLNSDTLYFNTYQKPANRASIVNKQETVSNYNVVFSAEHLTDTSTNIVLDDAYLENGLDPVLKLRAGTPPFQKTFAYQPGFIQQKKLQDIRQNHKLLMYSDLLMKETYTGDPSINLSTICDSDRLSFESQIKEEIPELHECYPWVLFDTVETENVSVNIPGEIRGVPNLRMSDKHLRENFILREIESTGTAKFSYSFYTDFPADTIFNLPASYKMMINDEYVDYPTLPIVTFDGDLATVDDISCTINGVPHTVTNLNPMTGQVIIEDYIQEIIGNVIVLTQENIDTCSITLKGYVTDPSNISFTSGTAQLIYKDFKVIRDQVTWYFSNLKEIFNVGDKVQLMYPMTPVGSVIEFTYHILNSAVVTMIDRDLSRIMDNGYVFGGLCYDQENIRLKVPMKEYFSFLDDDSDGIRLVFFNKDTLAVEEHIFSGPVFEIYSAEEDEIGVPQNFPNALIRIQNPLSLNNPLNYSSDYGFMYDSLVRFRKKKFQELLSDSSFRVLELVEMLPV